FAQPLARLVRERPPLETLDRIRQAKAGRFEVALHAYFELPIRVEPRRVDDGCANIFRIRAADLRRLHVLAPRTVASLAIDPLRQTARENRLCATHIV